MTINILLEGIIMYFQLLVGIHSEKVGVNESGKSIYKRYVAGDKFPSSIDLVKAFGSAKFRRLSDSEVKALNDKQSDTESKPKRTKTVKTTKVKRTRRKAG